MQFGDTQNARSPENRELRHRAVQPEILDSLPENHPDALANRRDLRLVNFFMGNLRWFARQLPRFLTPADRILEIGAGDGSLGLFLRKKLPPNFDAYSGLDLWSRPAAWPANWTWQQENLLHSNAPSRTTILLANLILHQFDNSELRDFGTRLRESPIRLILASEPARHRRHQFQLHLLRPLGFHPVSRHDGHVSIAAGFRNRELPALLGLDPAEWKIETRHGFLGSYRMIALRQNPRA